MRSEIQRAIVGLLAVGLLVPPGQASAGDAALPKGCVLAGDTSGTQPAMAPPKPVFPPLPVQVRALSVPVALPSADYRFLIYEVELQNYAETSVRISRLALLGRQDGAEQVLTTLSSEQLNAMLRPTGVDYLQYHAHAHGDANRELGGGRSAVAFLCLALPAHGSAPRTLRHRIELDGNVVDGPTLTLPSARLPEFAAILEGAGWHPRNGPDLDSHHRMGLMVAGGKAQNARRFAIDWRKMKDGKFSDGDPTDVHSYFSYGERVFSAAAGRVVLAVDGLPDNVPQTAAGFSLALPLTLENLGGNSVVIEHADGSFAHYRHLQPGSVSVRLGQRVRAGQALGRVGNSGDARNPHLHFQLTDGPDLFASEGRPFVFHRFRVQRADMTRRLRKSEFPWGNDLAIDFGHSSK